MRKILVSVGFLVGYLLGHPALAAEILIIANPSVEAAALTVKEVAGLYLLRVTVWPDGSHIVPVNREIDSELRRQFTAKVLMQGGAELAAYWNMMHFQGKLPPVVQTSEPAMLAFVQHVPGAVGYISASTVPSGVKVLLHVP